MTERWEYEKQAQSMGQVLGPATLGHPTTIGRQNLMGAVLNVMKKVSYVEKKGENEFHHYRYATESDTIAALRPAMIDEGLVITPSLYNAPTQDANGNTHIIMAYTLHHVPSGESWTIQIPASGNDRSSKGTVGDKGIYKAMTGALKYALRQTFMLETGDDPERGNDADADAQDKTMVQHLLKLADGLVTLANQCDQVEQLQEAWSMRISDIDLLKREHPELFGKVRDAFSARKKSLTPMSIEGGK